MKLITISNVCFILNIFHARSLLAGLSLSWLGWKMSGWFFFGIRLLDCFNITYPFNLWLVTAFMCLFSFILNSKSMIFLIFLFIPNFISQILSLLSEYFYLFIGVPELAFDVLIIWITVIFWPTWWLDVVNIWRSISVALSCNSCWCILVIWSFFVLWRCDFLIFIPLWFFFWSHWSSIWTGVNFRRPSSHI